MKELEIWQYVVLPFLSAGFGGWVTAQFALGRFRKEKAWERKSAAYAVIFEALYEMEKWFDVNWDDVTGVRHMTDEESKTLGVQYRAAREQLFKRIASESWILPDECLERIATLKKELEERNDDWGKSVDAAWGAVNSATKDLRAMVRIDLELKTTEPIGPHPIDHASVEDAPPQIIHPRPPSSPSP